MIRRTFSINGTPLYMERFKNEKVMLYEMDDNSLVEYMGGHYYNLTQDDNYIEIDSYKFNGFPHKLNGYPKKIIEKNRYYIPINEILDAKFDYCSDNEISPTISVDFGSREDADIFEIPKWFGEEILLKTKSKKKIIKN